MDQKYHIGPRKPEAFLGLNPAEGPYLTLPRFPWNDDVAVLLCLSIPTNFPGVLVLIGHVYLWLSIPLFSALVNSPSLFLKHQNPIVSLYKNSYSIHRIDSPIFLSMGVREESLQSNIIHQKLRSNSHGYWNIDCFKCATIVPLCQAAGRLSARLQYCTYTEAEHFNKTFWPYF